MDSIKINKLEIEIVKRIKAVKIEPTGKRLDNLLQETTTRGKPRVRFYCMGSRWRKSIAHQKRSGKDL